MENLILILEGIIPYVERDIYPSHFLTVCLFNAAKEKRNLCTVYGLCPSDADLDIGDENVCDRLIMFDRGSGFYCPCEASRVIDGPNNSKFIRFEVVPKLIDDMVPLNNDRISAITSPGVESSRSTSPAFNSADPNNCVDFLASFVSAKAKSLGIVPLLKAHGAEALTCGFVRGCIMVGAAVDEDGQRISRRERFACEKEDSKRGDWKMEINVGHGAEIITTVVNIPFAPPVRERAAYYLRKRPNSSQSVFSAVRKLNNDSAKSFYLGCYHGCTADSVDRVRRVTHKVYRELDYRRGSNLIQSVKAYLTGYRLSSELVWSKGDKSSIFSLVNGPSVNLALVRIESMFFMQGKCEDRSFIVDGAIGEKKSLHMMNSMKTINAMQKVISTIGRNQDCTSWSSRTAIYGLKIPMIGSAEMKSDAQKREDISVASVNAKPPPYGWEYTEDDLSCREDYKQFHYYRDDDSDSD